MISRKIHFVWIGGPMPEWAEWNIREFRRLNPDHVLCIHHEDALADEYRELYDQVDDLASKADLLRYSVLERYGGWYFDVDTVPLRPVSDIVNAYQLDGSKMFVGAQYPPHNKLWIANGAIGVSADWPGWPVLKRMLMATKTGGRVAFGPGLFTRFAREHRSSVEVADPPWFYGVRPEWSGKLYRAMRRGQVEMLRWHAETGGQFPFSFHLWAGNKRVDLNTPIDDSRTALITCTSDAALRDKSYQYVHIARGLESLGFRCEMQTVNDALDKAADIPSLMVVWNGRKGASLDQVQQAAKLGIPVIRLEHGFYQRKLYSQADHEGILHWASWRRELHKPAPADGKERLARFYLDGIKPMSKRHGYILVIGQVAGDSQMEGSELQSAIPLQRLIHRATKGKGLPVYFRPHPSDRCPNAKLLPRLEVADARGVYVKTKHGLGLAEALDGAAFIITINSNTIVEALAAGVPALAFGPHLGIEAGVVRQTCEATLRTDILEMLAGWRPDQESVQNFLEHLACRQWTPEEFADPNVISKLLDAAGVSHGRHAEDRCCVA